VLGSVLELLNDKGTVYVPTAKWRRPYRSMLARRDSPGRETHRPAGNRPMAILLGLAQNGRCWGPAGSICLDDSGKAVWFVDPASTAFYGERPDGSKVQKFLAPKAVLMSYIIKGILDRRLPWALVLLGVMIAVTLEMCAVSSLAFAVGVYLPLASSAPIFIGAWFAGSWTGAPGRSWRTLK